MLIPFFLSLSNLTFPLEDRPFLFLLVIKLVLFQQFMNGFWTLITILESKLCPTPPASRTVPRFPVTSGLCSFIHHPSKPSEFGWERLGWLSFHPFLVWVALPPWLFRLFFLFVNGPILWRRGPVPSCWLFVWLQTVSVAGIQVLTFSWWCLCGSFRGYRALHPQFFEKSDCPQAQTLPPHQAHICMKNTASSC